ncbi:unnamed protein product [Amoebophrya sp. A120]|nr:unnamed protein product [Amoebophrya sp. A120]|eukprot:GSA120T00023118001.1
MEFFGIIKSFSRQKGYGFVSCEETWQMFGRDVFLHQNVVDELIRQYPEPRAKLFYLGYTTKSSSSSSGTTNGSNNQRNTNETNTTGSISPGAAPDNFQQGGSSSSTSNRTWEEQNLSGVLVRFTLTDMTSPQPKAFELRGIVRKQAFLQEAIIGTLTNFGPPSDIPNLPGYATLTATIKNIGEMELGVAEEELLRLHPRPTLGDQMIFDLHRMLELPPPYSNMVPQDVERLDSYQMVLDFLQRAGLTDSGGGLTGSSCAAGDNSFDHSQSPPGGASNGGHCSTPHAGEQPVDDSVLLHCSPFYRELRIQLGVDPKPQDSMAKSPGSDGNNNNGLLTSHDGTPATANGTTTSGAGGGQLSYTQPLGHSGSSNGNVAALAGLHSETTTTQLLPDASNSGPILNSKSGASVGADDQNLINEGKWYTGMLKNYKDDKNYGFASCKELEEEGLYEVGRDVFVRNLPPNHYKPGEQIRFQITEFDGKPQAANVEEVPGNRYVGFVKSFDLGKGFGFIRCEELSAQYTGDVFVQATAYNEEVREQCPVGTSVEFCLWINNNNKPQALRLRKPQNEGRYYGVIKSYNQQNGYGFIHSNEVQKRYGKGCDVYLPSTVKDLSNLNIGDFCSFTVVLRSGKITAQGLSAVTEEEQISLLAQGMTLTAEIEVTDKRRYDGVVKKMFDSYGFLDCPVLRKKYNQDPFLQKSQIPFALQVGDSVTFQIYLKEDNMQPQACNLQRKLPNPSSPGGLQTAREIMEQLEASSPESLGGRDIIRSPRVVNMVMGEGVNGSGQGAASSSTSSPVQMRMEISEEGGEQVARVLERPGGGPNSTRPQVVEPSTTPGAVVAATGPPQHQTIVLEQQQEERHANDADQATTSSSTPQKSTSNEKPGGFSPPDRKRSVDINMNYEEGRSTAGTNGADFQHGGAVVVQGDEATTTKQQLAGGEQDEHEGSAPSPNKGISSASVNSRGGWNLSLISESQQKQLNKRLQRLCGSHQLHVEEMQQYLDLGANPNEPDISGFRPLMLCAMNISQTCCWQKIELLLQYSADLQLSTNSHPTVLAWMKERIGMDFAAQLEKLNDAIAKGQTPERPEHGYLFQDGGLEND